MDKDGRVLLLRPDHPFAKGKGYIYRSRLVVEYFANRLPELLQTCLPYLVEVDGRYYLDPEKKAVIHHLDHDKSNDDPENLAVTDNPHHMSYHRNYTLAEKTGDFRYSIRCLETDVGHMVKFVTSHEDQMRTHPDENTSSVFEEVLGEEVA